MAGLEAESAVGGAGARAGEPGRGAAPPRSEAAEPRRLPGWAAVAGPAAAELAIGGYRIGGPSLWRDEAATISGAQRPAGAILALARHQDAVHAVYYLLLHPVIAAGGTSAALLRLPSLVAMSLAAGLLGALGTRLARASALPAPVLTGLAAGLALAAVPLTTRYAQEARPYALTALAAVAATYCLVRAAAPGAARWWWVAYGAALVATGAFNLFAVLIAAGHGVSLAVAARPARAGRAGWPARQGETGGGPVAAAVTATAAVPAAATGAPLAPGTARRWLAACAAAGVLLAPLAVLTARQSGQLGWVTTPDASTAASLLRDFSGSALLIPVTGGLAWLGCVAGRGARRGAGLTLAVVALPWLVLPPAVLLAASFARPVYVERYVVFCLPALSLLVAAGLTGLPRIAARASASAPAGRPPRPGCRHAPALAWAPSAVLAALIAGLVAGPQVAIRQETARADDLRAVASVLAARERPGDAVVYLPWDVSVIAAAYQAPFARLENAELGVSPVASATLRGLTAAGPVVAARLAAARRVWDVAWAQPLGPSQPSPAAAAAERALAGMRLVRRWRIASVILSLYVRG